MERMLHVARSHSLPKPQESRSQTQAPAHPRTVGSSLPDISQVGVPCVGWRLRRHYSA